MKNLDIENKITTNNLSKEFTKNLFNLKHLESTLLSEYKSLQNF